MFRNPTLIKVLNAVALVVFILVMVICLLMAIFGLTSADNVFSSLENVDVYHGSGAVGGWGTIFAGIGVGLGSLGGIGAALIGIMGAAGALMDLVIYLPAFIARRIFKKGGSPTAYWVLMCLWLLLFVICIILWCL